MGGHGCHSKGEGHHVRQILVPSVGPEWSDGERLLPSLGAGHAPWGPAWARGLGCFYTRSSSSTVCRDQRTTLGLLVPWCDSSVQQPRLPLLDRISTKQHGGGAHLPLRFVDSVRHTTRSYRLQQQSSSAI